LILFFLRPPPFFPKAVRVTKEDSPLSFTLIWELWPLLFLFLTSWSGRLMLPFFPFLYIVGEAVGIKFSPSFFSRMSYGSVKRRPFLLLLFPLMNEIPSTSFLLKNFKRLGFPPRPYGVFGMYIALLFPCLFRRSARLPLFLLRQESLVVDPSVSAGTSTSFFPFFVCSADVSRTRYVPRVTFCPK